VLLTERQFIADEAQNVLKIKSDPVPRFIHVMKSLAYVYDLGLANLHIFNDTKGGLIVFNRNGSIFLNITKLGMSKNTRHYIPIFTIFPDDPEGIMTDALISWSPTSFFI